MGQALNDKLNADLDFLLWFGPLMCVSMLLIAKFLRPIVIGALLFHVWAARRVYPDGFLAPAKTRETYEFYAPVIGLPAAIAGLIGGVYLGAQAHGRWAFILAMLLACVGVFVPSAISAWLWYRICRPDFVAESRRSN